MATNLEATLKTLGLRKHSFYPVRSVRRQQCPLRFVHRPDLRLRRMSGTINSVDYSNCRLMDGTGQRSRQDFLLIPQKLKKSWASKTRQMDDKMGWMGYLCPPKQQQPIAVNSAALAMPTASAGHAAFHHPQIMLTTTAACFTARRVNPYYFGFGV